jgi:DNA-binding NtrC family response regulator
VKSFEALVIHSQPEALGELVELLTGPALRIDTARSETEALNKIRDGNVTILIAGHRPPSLDGISLLEASIAHVPDALRILVVSGETDADYLDQRPNDEHPIVRFVGRPNERSRLVALVHEGLKLQRLVREQRALVAALSGKHRKLQNREKLLDVVVRERSQSASHLRFG